MLSTKRVTEVTEFLGELIPAAKKPALMCSFGKDSMVLLDIARRAGHNIPILCFKDPWFPDKWAFSNSVIENWNLQVWDYPPLLVSMLYRPDNNKAVIVNDYVCGEGVSISIPHGIVESEKGICALYDVFGRPRANFGFPWDLCLVGHRDVDVDAIYGAVPLHDRILKREAGPDFAFPLKDWTDDEIWDYLEIYDVPVDHGRYDVEKRSEWRSKRFNSDYWEICINCIDKRKAGQKVYCHLEEKEIENISDKVPLFAKVPDYFDVENK